MIQSPAKWLRSHRTTPRTKPHIWEKCKRHLSDPTILQQAILLDGQLVGSIASFLATWGPPPPAPPQRHVTYWIAREHWGKGIATKALSMFLRDARMQERPLHASAARDNLASLRVLQKCGFVVIGYEKAFANARGKEIEEAMLLLV